MHQYDDKLLTATVSRLQAAKFVRAMAQGALVVVFALYLRELGWNAATIGVLFTVGGLAGAATGWIVGVTSDRVGRKGFVLVYELAAASMALVLVFSSHPVVLFLAAMVVGIGFAQNGIPLPVAAAEQAWLAQVVPTAQRGTVYSRNAGLGFFGMALGSALAGLVPLWELWLPADLAYRPFFLFTAVAAVCNYMFLRGAIGGARSDVTDGNAAADPEDPAARMTGDAASIRDQENRLMIKMALVNALNGLAVGLTGPLLAYWFNARFGVGPAAIGAVFSLSFVLTGFVAVWTGYLTERIGIVRAVILMRLAAVALLLLMPLLPVFWLAAVVHVIRTALARGTIGARQALAVSVVRPGRRGMASSLNMISMTLPISAGPSLAGVLIEAGRLGLPFYLAAGLQFLYGWLYGRLFQRYDIGPSTAAESSSAPAGTSRS